MKRVCVFCGSAMGRRPIYAERTIEVGRLLAERGLELVFGGGHFGLMGVLADSVVAAGGRVIGVIPRLFDGKEPAHPGVADMRYVNTMHERKAMMADLSDAFLALPGGAGTLDETFEMLTWAQIGLQRKPIGLLNVDGYFDALLAWIDHAFREDFIKEKHRPLLTIDTDAATLLDRLTRESSPPVRRP